MNGFAWTDENIAKLRSWHAQGASFSTIGVALGISRNAAIGKANRLGLEKRGVVRRLKAPPTFRRGPYRKRRIAETPPPIRAPTGQPIPFADLGAHHCRWPMSGDGADMLFCGAEIWLRSYCAHHYQMGYHAPAARKEAYWTRNAA